MSNNTLPLRASFLICKVVDRLCDSTNGLATSLAPQRPLECPFRFDRHEDVKSFAPGCLDKRMVPETLEMVLKVSAISTTSSKPGSLGRIQIKDEVIRLIEMWRAAMHLMKFDACQVCKPDERSLLGGDHVILLSSFPKPPSTHALTTAGAQSGLFF